MAFLFDFGLDTWKEFRYVISRRKPCPKCGNQLYRVDVLPEHSRGWKREGLNFTYTYTVRERYRYRCDPCHSYFGLEELVAGG